MTVITITPGNVDVIDNNAIAISREYGEGLDAGLFVAVNSSGLVVKADNTDEVLSRVIGMTLETKLMNEFGLILTAGPVAVGTSAITSAQAYMLSDTLGKMGANADITIGNYVVYLGQAETDDDFFLSQKTFGFVKD